MKKISITLMALMAGAFSACSSSSTNGDAALSDAGNADGGDAGGTTLFGLSTGDSCFDVTSIATGASDGCMLGVASLVGQALLVNYDMTTATVTLGAMGKLGAGQISQNMGTLTRDSVATDPTMAACSWQQTDDADVTLTATNTFTVSVTEVESAFASACSAPPAGGTCTSTWTWTMKKSTTKTTATACQ